MLSNNVKVGNKTVFQNLSFYDFSRSRYTVYSHMVRDRRKQNWSDSSFHVRHCFIANWEFIIQIVKFWLLALFCNFVWFFHVEKLASWSWIFVIKSFAFFLFLKSHFLSLITCINGVMRVMSLKEIFLSRGILLLFENV